MFHNGKELKHLVLFLYTFGVLFKYFSQAPPPSYTPGSHVLDGSRLWMKINWRGSMLIGVLWSVHGLTAQHIRLLP